MQEQTETRTRRWHGSQLEFVDAMDGFIQAARELRDSAWPSPGPLHEAKFRLPDDVFDVLKKLTNDRD